MSENERFSTRRSRKRTYRERHAASTTAATAGTHQTICAGSATHQQPVRLSYDVTPRGGAAKATRGRGKHRRHRRKHNTKEQKQRTSAINTRKKIERGEVKVVPRDMDDMVANILVKSLRPEEQKYNWTIPRGCHNNAYLE